MARKSVDLKATSRRDFIRWNIYIGSVLGLRPWRIFESIESTAGKALAAEASCLTTNRSVHIIAGNGGLAWFQLLWPHVDVAQAANPSFAYHAPGEGGLLQGTDMPLFLGPQAPWQSYGASKAITALMSGSNETHTSRPTSSSTLSTGVGLFAACVALQATAPTLVPVIGVNAPGGTALPYGAAPGAPAITSVPNADGMVGLFDSAASRMGGALAMGNDATEYEAYYKAFLSLNAAAGRSPTLVKSYGTAKSAAGLVGKNLSSALVPSSADLGRYGVGTGTPTKVLEIAKTLITTAKAFQLGLTNAVLLPAMNDDPHGAFSNMTLLQTTVTQLGKILDGFMGDLMAADDPMCAGRKIGDSVVLSVHGDTPKTPLNRSGWPDGTPNNSNWVYVLGNGFLKTGWFGGIKRDGTVQVFDPGTGAAVTGTAASTAMSASGAIAYAVAKGDANRVSEFFQGGALTGITRPQQQ